MGSPFLLTADQYDDCGEIIADVASTVINTQRHRAAITDGPTKTWYVHDRDSPFYGSIVPADEVKTAIEQGHIIPKLGKGFVQGTLVGDAEPAPAQNLAGNGDDSLFKGLLAEPKQPVIMPGASRDHADPRVLPERADHLPDRHVRGFILALARRVRGGGAQPSRGALLRLLCVHTFGVRVGRARRL